MVAVRPKKEQSLAGDTADSRTMLQVLRAVEGLTQEQLAERAGLARHTITRLEAKRHRPRRSTAVAIARALGYRDLGAVFPAHYPSGREGRRA